MTGQPHSNNANMNSTNQGRVRSKVQGSRERSKRDKFIMSIFVCHAERGFTPGKQVNQQVTIVQSGIQNNIFACAQLI
ncbi:hypothetical protein M153_5800004480 [Pseudoloma neurophilia]|uniref:Uncharacterized protein n=1 Tax=Pseudoloma neurophilia TaxID=146866 RepID=A0A0R0M5R9_9MICR|nr:hypothetical protein M153_5800004480 [Pseudoloma neurophilia]